MPQKLKEGRCCKITLPHHHCGCGRTLLLVPAPAGKIRRGSAYAASIDDKKAFERGEPTRHDVFNHDGQRVQTGFCLVHPSPALSEAFSAL